MNQTTNIEELERISRIVGFISTGDRKSAAAGYAFFVKRYDHKVLDFVSRMTDNLADAEDLAQNAFIKAFSHLQGFEGRATFLSWVCRIAYNEAITHLKRKKLNFISIDDTQVSDTEISDDEFSTGKEERIQELEAALDLLNPDDKMLVHLYYYEDKPIKEIAFIMDAEPNALAVRLHRIRKKLAEMIKH
ncbi:MAG: sigma-70 family RNA polymerase sigma factor [Bacteroidales bacterium]|nr:sigma-70 family RNA polymerase sigma factor [Bacteroidales bacterium]